MDCQRRARVALVCRRIAGVLGFILPLMCLPAVTLACLWDRDTLRYEAKGLPGIVEVITGRFEREPPLYYEMRLERVTREIAADPARLDLYDDAGVACDRLHRGDEAVEWMAKKRAALDAMPDSPEKKDHEYRYHANLGTFLAHQWLRGGADRASMQDMLDGCEHIKRAIEINPDAHFGREKYQLLAMEWIISPPTPDEPDHDVNPSGTIFDKLDGIDRPRPYTIRTTTEWRPDAPDGLAGLIVMGDAWQSVDIYNALGVALQAHGHTSLDRLAILRARELIQSGKQSINEQLRADDPNLDKAVERIDSFLTRPEQVDRFYTKARAAADDWHAKRTAFMMERLESGRHPDTDATFWDGYRETKPPRLPGSLKSGEQRFATNSVLALGLVVLIGIGLIVGAIVIIMRVSRWWRP